MKIQIFYGLSKINFEKKPKMFLAFQAIKMLKTYPHEIHFCFKRYQEAFGHQEPLRF